MAQKTAGVVSATVQATRTLLVLLVILGLTYPCVTWLVGRLNANGADGSFLEYNGQAVGSKSLDKTLRMTQVCFTRVFHLVTTTECPPVAPTSAQ